MCCGLAHVGIDDDEDDEEDEESGLGVWSAAAAGEDADAATWPRTLAVHRITEPRLVQLSGEDSEAALEEEEPGRGPLSAWWGTEDAPPPPPLTAWNTALACIRFSMYWLSTEFSERSLRFSSLTESTRFVRSSRVF